jgi:hypothetical protein
MAKTANKKKERGKLLTIMIILVFLLQILDCYGTFALATSPSPWFFMSVVSVFAVIVLSLYGIWRWKRWALYVNFAVLVLGQTMSFVNFFTDKLYFYPPSVILQLHFWALYGPLLWAIHRKWQYFE